MMWQLTQAAGSLLRYENPLAYPKVNPPTPTRTANAISVAVISQLLRILADGCCVPPDMAAILEVQRTLVQGSGHARPHPVMHECRYALWRRARAEARAASVGSSVLRVA